MRRHQSHCCCLETIQQCPSRRSDRCFSISFVSVTELRDAHSDDSPSGTKTVQWAEHSPRRPQPSCGMSGGRTPVTQWKPVWPVDMTVPVLEAKRFVLQAMVAVGTVRQHAQQLADVLVTADYMGHYSHGLNRLGEWHSLRAFRDSCLRHIAAFN